MPEPRHFKIAASALRKRVSVGTGDTSTPNASYAKMLAREPEKYERYVMRVSDKPAGEMFVHRGTQQVSWSEINKKYRGMGLGKKMYGEVMKKQPGGELAADSLTSKAARRVWDGLKSRGYESGRNPLAWPAIPIAGFRLQPAGAPNYVARLPESARKALNIKNPSAMQKGVKAVRRYGGAAIMATAAAIVAGKKGAALVKRLRKPRNA